jgi:hypothetical protein
MCLVGLVKLSWSRGDVSGGSSEAILEQTVAHRILGSGGGGASREGPSNSTAYVLQPRGSSHWHCGLRANS